MGIKFDFDWEITSRVREIVNTLGLAHVKVDRLVCMRSRDSKARGTIARCYALSKIWQKALNVKAHYIIEIISERFDRLSKEDQDKTLIHELLHVPKSFGGGFKHHGNWVTRGRVDACYMEYVKRKEINQL